MIGNGYNSAQFGLIIINPIDVSLLYSQISNARMKNARRFYAEYEVIPVIFLSTFVLEVLEVLIASLSVFCMMHISA